MNQRSESRRHRAVARLGLVAIVTAFVVAMLCLLAPTSSASPLLHPQKRVAAIAEPGRHLVGPHGTVLPGGSRPRAPSYDQTATGSSVAAEGGAGGNEAAWGPGTRAAGQPPDEPTVAEILKGKLGSIQRAPLPPGSPGWSDITNMTLSEIRTGAQADLPGADLADSIWEVCCARANEAAELDRILSEHHLDEAAASAWQPIALEVAGVARSFLGVEGPSACEHAGPGVELTRARFEELVVEALDSIPADLASHMQNVAVVVEDRCLDAPNAWHVFGLYVGTPLTKRTRRWRGSPDKIAIYQEPICWHADTEDKVVAKVRQVVIHEVGHHFGIGDDRLHQLGW